MTTSKEASLKKLLIKNLVIVVAALAVVLGIALYLTDYNDTVQADLATKQGQNNAASAEYKDIEATLGRQNEVAKYYEEYAKTHNTNFAIDRETIAGFLNSMRKTHHFADNLEVTVSSITDVPDNGMGIKSGKLVKSTVHIVFKALTDNSVYNFIYDLQHNLPGSVIVTELEIAKSDDLSQNILTQAISHHTLTPMVKGQLSFLWLGVRPTPETPPATGASNAR